MSIAEAPERSLCADPLEAAWRRRRAEFTHDWLRNRLLPRLHGCTALTGPGVIANTEIVERLYASVKEWPSRSSEALALADEFAEIMSPARAVDSIAPALEPGPAAFLRTTALELWRVRHGVPLLLDEIRLAVCDADQAYAEWTDRDSEAALRRFAGQIERLARALSALPPRAGL